jgi:dethiobiotin synthetase/adenosylmethionine--8-amino-7-oxononanoate aminotransferase
MEPVILGAGGMIFVDPLFQKSLARVVRRYNFATSESDLPAAKNEHAWTGLPVMFDEVFTGLYRLGRFSSASFLDVHPDISVHAKLLTGGLLPLSITAASDSIFQAFWGDEKSEALLHGHSYTAHPIGSHVANESLIKMQSFKYGPRWWQYRRNWQTGDTSALITKEEKQEKPWKKVEDDKIWSFWSKQFVLDLSQHKRVDHVNALGSVLAVSLKDGSGAGKPGSFLNYRFILLTILTGYTSSAAVGLRDALLFEKSKVQIHSRILGNVIYLMASMITNRKDIETVEEVFKQKLDAMVQEA